MRSKRLLLVLVLATIIRLLHLTSVWNDPVLTVPIIDARYYHTWATSLAGGEPQANQVFFMSPLYPYFLSLFYRVLGADPRVAAVVQALLGIALVYLIYRLSLKFFGEERIALVAALLAALYRPFVYYESVLLSALPILLLNGMALLMLLSARPNPARLLLSGILLGLSALARPSVLLFAFFAGGYMLFLPERRFKNALLLLCGVIIALVPVAYRNYQASGRLILATAGLGMNFYVGNNPEASGVYQEAHFLKSAQPENESEDYRAEASGRAGKELDVVEASDYWLKEGILFALDRPGKYLRLLLRKFFLFFHATEIPNNLSIYGVSAASVVLRWIPFAFGLIAPLGIAYWMLNLRKAGSGLIHLYGLSYLLATLIFFAASEYRLPIMLVVIPYAAAAICALWDCIRSKAYSRGARLIVFSILFALCINLPTPFTATLKSPRMDFFNLGSVLQHEGRQEEAVDLFKRALSVDPNFTAAHLALGESYLILGRREAAAEEFRRGGISLPATADQP
jgi:4-amino-4-deoxy-L-arabinose transferase-like glycosyltransferase